MALLPQPSLELLLSSESEAPTMSVTPVLAIPTSTALAVSRSLVSHSAANVQWRTVTVIEVLYLAPQDVAAAPASSSSAISLGSASSEGAPDLAGFAAGDAYEGLGFGGLTAAFASLLLTLLIVLCITAFFLRKARQMKALLEEDDEETELGQAASREKGKGRLRMQTLRQERRGLILAAVTTPVMLLQSHRRRPCALAVAALTLLALSLNAGCVSAQDEVPTASQPETMKEPLPTLSDAEPTATEEAPQSVPLMLGAGNRANDALKTILSKAEVGQSVLATMTASAPWATKTAGGMEQSVDANNTVVLHSDSSITYSCPNEADQWTVEDLTDALSAHTATGAGCTVSYAFKGDSIFLYGATAPDAGVFGCSVEASGRNFTAWYNAQGSANVFKPYQGSCSMQGLGFDKHTVQFVNSPYQPQKIYFTGLRFSTNSSENPWEERAWQGCCAGYTFPDGVPTVVEIKPSATGTTGSGNGTTGVFGMSSRTGLFLILGLGLAIVLASVLVGCMCCRKRPASAASRSAATLKKALHSEGDESSKAEPLRKRHKGARREKERKRDKYYDVDGET
ncbi:uncharacterized protein JCM10292_002820 [Rhodotorula paludigena]|uniref:uncharacterized protein n=1 Tax=Rhodotorula paludigena TaxID=86838 RepID=UPI003182390B